MIIPELPPPQFINLESLPDVLRVEEHFSRGDWDAIAAEIERRTDASQLPEAWHEAVLQWLFRLKGELGGPAQVFASRECLGLSDVESEEAQAAFAFADYAVRSLRQILGAAARDLGAARPLLFLFADDDDYFTYLSRYHGEGAYALSAGSFIGAPGDLSHMALPFTNPMAVRATIAHELTHLLVAHLPLPSWLNEGLAMGLEGALTRTPSVQLDRELAERLREFWSPDNIQEFWAGRSFFEPGEASELSYALASILTQWLQQKEAGFREFIQQAQWQDAGQHAALEVLGECLGNLLAGLLGPGDWRPQRATIARLLGPTDTADASSTGSAE